jgi:hypothetical protein
MGRQNHVTGLLPLVINIFEPLKKLLSTIYPRFCGPSNQA